MKIVVFVKMGNSIPANRGACLFEGGVSSFPEYIRLLGSGAGW